MLEDADMKTSSKNKIVYLDDMRQQIYNFVKAIIHKFENGAMFVIDTQFKEEEEIMHIASYIPRININNFSVIYTKDIKNVYSDSSPIIYCSHCFGKADNRLQFFKIDNNKYRLNIVFKDFDDLKLLNNSIYFIFLAALKKQPLILNCKKYD